jgi:hypothetical protein
MKDPEFIVAVSPFRRALNYSLASRSRWSPDGPDAHLEKARLELERYGTTHEVACLGRATCDLLVALAKLLKAKQQGDEP